MLAEILSVRPDEVDQAVAVWEAAVRATHDFVSEDDIRIFRPLVRAALQSMRQCVVIHDSAGQVAGFLGAAAGKIEMLFIDPVWRGQGIGRRLLEHAVQVFGATGLDVNEQNQSAFGFYRHMGFVVVGRSERDGLGKPYPLLHLRLEP